MSIEKARAAIRQARINHQAGAVNWVLDDLINAIDGLIVARSEISRSAGEAEAELAALRDTHEKVRAALDLAALDADVCTAECDRCGRVEPIKDWDISIHVREALALLTAPAQPTPKGGGSDNRRDDIEAPRRDIAQPAREDGPVSATVTVSRGCVFCDLDQQPEGGVHHIKANGEWHDIPCRLLTEAKAGGNSHD